MAEIPYGSRVFSQFHRKLFGKELGVGFSHVSNRDFFVVTQNFDEFFDQRRYRRVAMTGDAKVNFGGRWHLCQIIDLSGGGARFRSEIRPVDGANVLVQLRGVGIVRAAVVYRDKSCFAVQFNGEDYDSGALVDNLMLPANAALMARGEESEKLSEETGSGEGHTDDQKDADTAENEEAYQQLLEENKGRHPLHVRRLLKG